MSSEGLWELHAEGAPGALSCGGKPRGVKGPHRLHLVPRRRFSSRSSKRLLPEITNTHKNYTLK